MRAPVSKPVAETVKPLPIEGKKPEPPVPLALAAKDTVLIGIRVEVTETVVISAADIDATNLKTNKKETWPAGTYHFTSAGGELLKNGKPIGPKWRLRSSDRNVFFHCGVNGYRGDLIVRAVGDKKLTVVNELAIDDYLKGVLPREVSPTWPQQALRVQAVASRTYLASHLGTHQSQGFDLCADVHCQVYGGMTKEHPKTNEAVDATHNQILIYDGKPISAFFHSNCGGSTEEVQYVWGTAAKPYLPRVKCGYGTSNPGYNWTYTVAATDMLATLKAKTPVKGKKLESVKIKHKSPSGRAEFFTIVTDVGSFELSGNALRIAMNPEKIRSTLLTDFKRTGNSYIFSGRGWGHGVGMCQWGAKGQAELGRDYRDILQYYYPHTTLTTWSR